MKLRSEVLCLSATDLSNSLGCAHLSELDHSVAIGALPKPQYFDPMLALLRAHGERHEAAYLEHLQEQRLDVALISADLSPSAAIAETKRLMAAGAAVIYQGVLADESAPWEGRADFLIRVERPSNLGQHSYEVVDTKLATETRAGTLLQLCLYSDMVSQVQGLLPENMVVVTPVDGLKPQRYRVNDFIAYYRFARRSLVQRIESSATSYPEPVEQCDICRWRERCETRRRADDHLSLVAGISRSQRAELVEHGLATLELLAEAAVPLPFMPMRGSRESLARVQKQAQLQLRGRRLGKVTHELLRPVEAERGFNRLPAPSYGDVFLDLEGDPFTGEQGLEYLFGWGWSDQSGWKYEHLWARNATEERQTFERFMKLVMARLADDPGMHIYHYAPYEPSAFKRLAGRHGTCMEDLDELLRGERFVDLYQVVRQSVVASVESYSIKRLEPLIGFVRQVALDTVGKHKRAVEGLLQFGQQELPVDAVDVVRGYNDDDCHAALALRDWLEEQRAILVAAGEPVVRPSPKAGAPTEKLGAWLATIQELERQLLACLPEEGRSDKEQGRWLLAHMLRWHHRETKCFWWERFRLAGLEPEEQRREGKVLSSPVFEREVDASVYNVKRACRFRFQVQELEIRRGQSLVLPNAEKKFPTFGEVLAIDRANGWVDLGISAKCDVAAAEREGALFQDELVPTKPLPDALQHIAEQTIADSLDMTVSNPLAAKLLHRIPMAALSLPREQPWEIASHLAGDVLPVQGPPGAGKSYAGARMILRLCREGKKVGVTANSHAVIELLLRAVAGAAQEEGVPVPRMMHVDRKAKDDPVVPAKTKEAALRAFGKDEVDVLGGTAWLWASEQTRGLVHTLVIDEAGQMSLANAVACTPSTQNLVLLGDPQQLAQPIQATHPDGIDVSALQHLLGESQAISPDRGVFLESTYRMHPTICAFISELYYEGRLHSAPGLHRQQVHGVGDLSGSGLRLEHVTHNGNSSRSAEEVAHVQALVQRLLASGRYTDLEGTTRPLVANDILIVAPFNAQVHALRETMPDLEIGTVDKFQGREAPVVIYSMTSSTPDDAPRGMSFLYDPHRFNVAISRARALAILVASPALHAPSVRSPEQMRLANAMALYAEMSVRATSS
jgi:predicted RecB family nuclease